MYTYFLSSPRLCNTTIYQTCRIKARAPASMSSRQQPLLELLVKLGAQTATKITYKHQLSEESRACLWDHEDLVRDVYVIVRHFTVDKFGTHVALAAPVIQTETGESHEYRLPEPTLPASYQPAAAVAASSITDGNERVGVYIFNPAVCSPNPEQPTPFEVRRGLARAAVDVQPDTCPLVHTIPAADMHGAVTVFVTDALTDFRVSLCFYFE